LFLQQLQAAARGRSLCSSYSGCLDQCSGSRLLSDDGDLRRADAATGRRIALQLAHLSLCCICFNELVAHTGAVDFRLPILSLSPMDSGSGPAARITYQASPRGALVRLLGGLPLPARLWQPWTLRIPADAPATGGYDAGSDVTALTLNLTDAGVPAWADLGSFINAGAGSCSSSRAELWNGQRPMMVARWPNARPADSLSTFDHLESVINTTALTVSTTRPLRWVNETAPWLTGYWVYDWADMYVERLCGRQYHSAVCRHRAFVRVFGGGKVAGGQSPL